MVVMREMVFSHIDQKSVRDSYTMLYSAARRGALEQPESDAVVSRQLGQLFAHVAGADYPVSLGDGITRSRQQFQKWQLVGHRGETMEAYEVDREQTRILNFTLEENPIFWNENIIEYRQRFHPLAARADRMFKRILWFAAVRAGNELETRGVDWQGERDHVGLVTRFHHARGQYD